MLMLISESCLIGDRFVKLDFYNEVSILGCIAHIY